MSENGSRDVPRWEAVIDVLTKHYKDPDTEAARVLCAALASHALKQFAPAWCLAIAPPGSMKTDFLESFRGLPGVHFVDEVTTNTFLSGKVDERGKKRTKPAGWLHRIGKDGVLIAAERPRVTVDAAKVASLRASGASWQTITRQLGISAGTAKRAFYGLSKNPSHPASVTA